MENLHWEPLAPACRVLVSREHTFNTDTILLAHFAAPKHKERCIDLGTGCGTIPLLWQANYAPRHITAVELGEQAFSQALRSVSENGYEENIEVIRGDIREIKKIIPHPALDLAACNPPYKAVGAGLRNPDERMENARHECTCTLEDVTRSGRDDSPWRPVLPISAPERLAADAMNVLKPADPKQLQLVQRMTPHRLCFYWKCGATANQELSVLPTLIIEGAKAAVFRRNAEICGNQIRSRGRTSRWKKINCFAVHCMWWARPSEICRIFRPARRRPWRRWISSQRRTRASR